MIKINYENEETGQKMDVEVTEKDKGTAEVKTTFMPKLEEGSIDPYGIIDKLCVALGLDGGE